MSVELGAGAEARPTPAGASDRFEPALGVTADGWLLGFREEGPEVGRRLAVAFTGAEAREGERLAVSAVVATGEAVGLRLAGAQAVWLAGSGGERRIVARRLSVRGGLEGSPGEVVLAQGEGLGLPEAAVAPAGTLVAWTDGERVHAVRLDAEGIVAERASAWGGSARPSRFEDEPRVPAQRSAATRARPSVGAVSAAGVELYWEADWWFSDDQGGTVLARRLLAWGEEEGEPEEAPRPGADAWTHVREVVPGAAGLRVLAHHDPNGGPWSLALARPGAEPLALALGPAGPFTVAARDVSGPVVAFFDPAASAYRVVRFDAAWARHEVAIPTLALHGEAAVALADGALGGAAGERVGVAYTTVVGGRLDVRLAVVAPGEAGERAGGRAVRPAARAVALGASFSPSHLDAVYAGGHTLLSWQDHWAWDIRTVWLRDGVPVGPVVTHSGGAARAEGGSVAALPDGGALVAFHTCDARGVCGTARLRALKLAPGKDAVPVELGARPDDRHPRLCVGAMGPVLAVQRGAYGSVSVTWEEGGARRTVDVPTPDHNNGALPQGVSCGEAGIFVAMTSYGGAPWATRVDVVAITAAGATTRATLGAAGHLWSANALVDGGPRVGLFANLPGGVGSDLGVRWFGAGEGAAAADAIVWRGGQGAGTHAVGRGGDVAAAWYERESDGVYAALIGPDGGRRAAPVRLDDPAARESLNTPVVVREGDGWWVYWREADALWRAQPF